MSTLVLFPKDNDQVRQISGMLACATVVQHGQGMP